MERLFTALQEERIIGVEIRVLAMDSTSVKVHRLAEGAPEKGAAVRRRIPGRQERQSSRGVRRRVDARRNPFEPGRRARRGHGRRSMAASWRSWARSCSWTAFTRGIPPACWPGRSA